jgi:hypothetical protein
MQMQGYDYVQMQYSNSVALPVSPYDIGTGSWFYLDAGGAVWQSNTTGALQTVVLGNNGNISATGNITAPYFIGNGSQLTGIVANSVANANYANFAGEAYNVNVANVTGLGNIATVNLDGNVSNLLTGAGTFVAIPTGGGNTDNISNGTSNVSIPVIDGNVQVYANNQHWAYNTDGSTIYPTLSTQRGDNPSGTITGQTLLFGDNTQEAIVSTPDGNSTYVNSQRLVINPGQGYDYGEGGDIYLWAGRGGANNGSGGDIKVRGGQGMADGTGGYIRIEAGDSQANGQAGYVQITGGQGGNTVGGAINVTGGYGATGGGDVTLAGGSSAEQGGNFYIQGGTSGNGVPKYGNVQVSSGASSWKFDNSGNLTLPANTFAINYANGTQVPLDGPVANANYANFAGTAYSVAGANVSGIVANANFASYANVASSANSVNVANVVGIGNIATTNYDGNASNILYGNGGFYALPVISNVANANYANYAGQANTANLATFATTANAVAGANVSGQVANALVAGTIYTNAQPNITSTGNLVSLNVISSNTVLPTTQIQPTGVVIGSTANANLLANSLVVVTDYGNGQGDGNLALTKATAYVKARGNSTIPTAVSAGDFIHRDNFLANNGTSNVLHASIRTAVANTNANANAIWGGGNTIIFTGNPLGDTGNANAQSAYNTYSFDQWGRQIITQGTAPTGVTNGLIVFNTYGGTAGANGNAGSGIVFNRFFGNRDSNLAVGPGAQTGRIVFTAANSNGSATTFATRIAQFGANVDNSYVQGNANVPQGMFMQVCDNTTQYTHNFYANSATALSGNLSVAGGSLTLTKTAANAVVFSLFGDKTASSQISLQDAQFSVSMSNVDTTTGFSPFRFSQFAPTNNQFGPMFYYRSRGNSFANSAPVVAGDQIMQYNFLVNSNNVTTSVGSFSANVTYNDNAGNVGTRLDFNSQGTGTDGYANSSVNFITNTTSANNFQANNVTILNGTNNFMKLSSYTAANLTAITGSIGWMAAVSDSAGGGNPNGMIAFWDTTHSRWSYIHDNSAV